MRMIMALLGYLAVATVITQGALFGYLWSGGILNDEKMFQIVALIHDIDLNQTPGTEEETVEPEIPDEEPSLAEVERMREIALRNFEAKQNSLRTGKSEFNYVLRQLNSASDRYDRLATELADRINQESEELRQENVQNVVRDLQLMKSKEAKEIILRMLDEGGSAPEAKAAAMDEVILIVNTLRADSREALLRTFTSPDDLDKLHDLLQRMLSGGAKAAALDDVKQQLKDRDFTK